MSDPETRPPVPYLPSIGRLLGFANRASTALSEQKLGAHGLTLQQWILLTALWRSDEGMTIGQLAAYCRVREPTASSLVDRMEAKGLVARERAGADRRKVFVNLTDKSRGMTDLLRFYEGINAVILLDFSEAEAEALTGMLERVIANVEAALDATPEP